VVNLFATHNNVTITCEEIDKVLKKGQQLMGDMGIEAGYRKLYSAPDTQACNRTLLYLYCYAIETWQNCEDGTNYMCEEQLIKLLSEVEQLFYICQCKVS